MGKEKGSIGDTAIKKNGNIWLVYQLDWISCTVHGTKETAEKEAKIIAKDDDGKFIGEI